LNDGARDVEKKFGRQTGRESSPLLYVTRQAAVFAMGKAGDIRSHLWAKIDANGLEWLRGVIRRARPPAG